jgi:hypothetical protein
MIGASMRALVFVVCLCVCARPVLAQSTRAETIAEQQAEKAKQLGVEGPSRGEQIIRRILLSPLLSGGDGLYPWFGSVFGGTGMALGAGYWKRLENNARINFQTGFSLNNSMMVRAEGAAPELWRGRLRVEGAAHWFDARGVSFYGLGPSSDVAARDRYDFKPFELSGTATLRPFRYVWLAGGYSFLEIDTTRDLPRFSVEEMPGIDQDLTYQVTRGHLVIDWRPSPGYSTRGGYYRFTVDRHHETTGRPFSFSTREVELVQLLPLLREQFVLAGRAVLTQTTPDGGHDVPVMLAPFLGSGSTLRGFATRRFTDRNRVLLSGEYRWRPSRYLDMAVFLDAGQVAADRADFDVSAFETNWGLGARFHGPLFTALRIEVARSREGTRMVFAGSQAF